VRRPTSRKAREVGHPPVWFGRREALGLRSGEGGHPPVLVQSNPQAKRRANTAQTDLFDQAPQHIWQKRYYDFNVWTEHKRIEKLRYMHRNPVKRGLVESPEFWRWSSYRAYFLGETGAVEINEWEVLKMKMRSPAA